MENGYDYILSEKEDLTKFIYNLVNRLPERHSAIISMFYLDEMSCEEISEVMNITVSNVKVKLYRSRNALKDLIVKGNLTAELI